jgi:hypothetical protein
MSRGAAVLGVVALAGCGGGTGSVGSPAPDQVGTFAYEASFEVQHQSASGSRRSERLEIRGVVEVEADTVRLDARHGLCHPIIRPNPTRFVFTCDEYTLSFDRRYPTMNPRFGGAIPVGRVAQGPCAEWRTNPNGSRTCLRYEYYDVPGTQQVTGVLRLRPVRGDAVSGDP